MKRRMWGKDDKPYPKGNPLEKQKREKKRERKKGLRMALAFLLVGMFGIGGAGGAIGNEDGAFCGMIRSASAADLEKAASKTDAVGNVLENEEITLASSSEDTVTSGEDGVLEYSAGQDEGIMLIDELGDEETAEDEASSDSADDAQTDSAAAGEESSQNSENTATSENGSSEVVTLRICSWEEYIDLGGWDADETIDLPSGDIIGVNSMIADFEAWYEETYGVRVKAEYSTFGTNEDLYNMLTLGDVYDLVCPSEYMIMKLMAEDQLVPLSDGFFDTENEYNYYINGVSPFIKNMFDTQEIDGENWGKYAAGYMWGVTGIVYNPEVVSAEDASSWKILNDEKYYRQVTIKDNVRDSYFAAVGAIKSDLLTSVEFLSDPDYSKRLEAEMNDVSEETVAAVEAYLQDVKGNAYSFETDSGKADMITGKVVANYQWSGDAVYTLDQADEDDYTLCFAVPEEATNIYFDGWVMLKKGVEGDAAKQQAAEAFINFMSRPDNVIRNMYYIGYTSVISGGDDGRIFEYAQWNFGADEDAEDTVEYAVGNFFAGDSSDENYVITTTADQLNRQLYAQYPDEETLARASIMTYFDSETSERVNQMWIHVRCFNVLDVPVGVWIAVGAAAVAGAVLLVRRRRRKKGKTAGNR